MRKSHKICDLVSEVNRYLWHLCHSVEVDTLRLTTLLISDGSKQRDGGGIKGVTHGKHLYQSWTLAR